jgi:putative DNA methylase
VSGIGKDARFWKLAQSLSALYPPGIDEKRWVDGVLVRKESLGLSSCLEASHENDHD